MNGRWTKEEQKYLIDNYATSTIDEIAEAIGRSKGSVVKQAYDLRRKGELDIKNSPVRRFTEEEEQFIIDNYMTMKVREIASALDRSIGCIRYKAKILRNEGRLEYKNNVCIPMETIDFITTNYDSLPITDIAEALDRSVPYVAKQIVFLGLGKDDK